MTVGECKTGDVVFYKGKKMWLGEKAGALRGYYTSKEYFESKKNTGIIRNSAKVMK